MNKKQNICHRRNFVTSLHMKLKYAEQFEPLIPGQVSDDVLNSGINNVIRDKSARLGEGGHPRVADVVDQLLRDQGFDLFPLPRGPDQPDHKKCLSC